MTTWPVVLKTRFIPWSTSLPSTPKSGPRWSMVGKSMARRTRSGTLVGPGIWRKWRPAVRGITPPRFACKPREKLVLLADIAYLLYSAYKMADSQDITPIIRRPLHEEATDRLRDLIGQGRLAAGARLNERLLTAQLGVSRTPLREAFKVLATEGLVELLPNRGAIVSQLDPVRLAESLVVMGALAALAAALPFP